VKSFVLLATNLGFIWAQALGVSGMAAPNTRTLILEPVPCPPLRVDFDFRFNRALPAFAKEPPFTGKEIARGFLPTVPPTPFIRDITDNELYLNTQHQPDFIDGRIATYRSAYLGHVVFRNLHLSSECGGLTIPYTVDLYTYEQVCSGWLEVRSGWAGELELDGERWRLGIVDNLDGEIGAQDTLFLENLTPRKHGLPITLSPVPRSLFLSGHLFDADFTFKRASNGATGVVMEATLTQRDPPLARLNLDARGCRYVCLTNEAVAAILEGSRGPVTLPAGVYQVADCLLEREPGQFRFPTFVRCAQTVPVPPDRASTLRLGLPLENTVLAHRDGNLLRLTYQLLGAGGEQYEYYNWTNRPSFSIYQGHRRLATGKLPFG
jgi:hypothetical protein